VSAEQATDPIAFHAEGPVWSARWRGLRWVHMLAGDVLSLAEDGTVSRRHVGSVVAAVRPRAPAAAPSSGWNAASCLRSRTAR
jgi:hypothetical protein